MFWNGQKIYIWKNRLIWAGLVYHSSFHCASDVLERSTHHSTNHCKQKYDDDVSQVKLRVGPSSNQPSSSQVASRTRHPGQIWRADGEKQHLAACLWSGWLTTGRKPCSKISQWSQTAHALQSLVALGITFAWHHLQPTTRPAFLPLDSAGPRDMSWGQSVLHSQSTWHCNRRGAELCSKLWLEVYNPRYLVFGHQFGRSENSQGLESGCLKESQNDNQLS